MRSLFSRTNVTPKISAAVIVTFLALILTTACGDRSQSDDATAADSLSTPQLMERTDSALILGVDATDLTDGAILAFLTESNAGEISVGKVAASKGTHKAVRNFGQQMVDAHTKMQQNGSALAEKLNIMPEPVTTDSSARMNSELEARLNSIAQGPAFDTAYIKSQVAAHERVLNFVNRAEDITQSADLKQLLTDTAAEVQHHLAMAREVEDELIPDL